jgi:hypothetical protein
VKLTISGALPECGAAEKAATGDSKPFDTVIWPDFVNALAVPVSFNVRVTEYCPALLYTCAGFCSVEFVPSPKSQTHEPGDPTLWSVKLIVRGVFPELGDAENSGSASTFITAELESVPFGLLPVRLTV